MDKEIGRLTVFFEEPFWIGIFERISDRLRFSPVVAADVKEAVKASSLLSIQNGFRVSLNGTPFSNQRLQDCCQDWFP